MPSQFELDSLSQGEAVGPVDGYGLEAAQAGGLTVSFRAFEGEAHGFARAFERSLGAKERSENQERGCAAEHRFMLPDRVWQHQLRIITQIGKRLRELVMEAERDLAQWSDSRAGQPTIAGGWSRNQILGHPINSASNNHQRFVRAMLADEMRWPGYEQEGWVRVDRFQEARWSELVQLWASYNRFLAHVLAGVPEAKRKTPCFIGANPVMTLEALAADYPRHIGASLGADSRGGVNRRTAHSFQPTVSSATLRMPGISPLVRSR